VVISPLISHEDINKRKYHFLMGGGVPAREAAKEKVLF
jgi:hypothetical protein